MAAHDGKYDPIDRSDRTSRDDRKSGELKTDGRSDIDQGAYDDGNPGERTSGEGVYREDQAGAAQPDADALDQGSENDTRVNPRDRGAEGGRARGDGYGNTGSERYGGGGPNGGTRDKS